MISLNEAARPIASVPALPSVLIVTMLATADKQFMYENFFDCDLRFKD